MKVSQMDLRKNPSLLEVSLLIYLTIQVMELATKESLFQQGPQYLTQLFNAGMQRIWKSSEQQSVQLSKPHTNTEEQKQSIFQWSLLNPQFLLPPNSLSNFVVCQACQQWDDPNIELPSTRYKISKPSSSIPTQLADDSVPKANTPQYSTQWSSAPKFQRLDPQSVSENSNEQFSHQETLSPVIKPEHFATANPSRKKQSSSSKEPIPFQNDIVQNENQSKKRPTYENQSQWILDTPTQFRKLRASFGQDFKVKLIEPS